MELNLNVHLATVWRCLSSIENIVRAKLMPAPRLKDHHKEARLEFARLNMNRDWTKVGLLQ